MTLSEKEIATLKDIVSLPTAPFNETAVQEYVYNWCDANKFEYKQDKSGNILIGSEPAKKSSFSTPWVLQAHMDHPGFMLTAQRGKSATAWFIGGVAKEYFVGTKMQFIPAEAAGISPVKGVVTRAVKDKDSGFLKCTIQLQKAVDLPSGTLGMWDLPVWKRNGDLVSLRVADDLGGVSAVLLTLARLKRRKNVHMPMGLLTRAEETGFIGSIAAAKNKLIKNNWPILGIETSKAQIAAPIGKGAVIRLGDRMSMFDPELTMALRQAADKILTSSKNKKLTKQGMPMAYNAALMPGGSTESTMLALMGYRTCATCLPLGNYHNMGTKKIAPEQIALSDMASLVELLAEVSQIDVTPEIKAKLNERLMANYAKKKQYL